MSKILLLGAFFAFFAVSVFAQTANQPLLINRVAHNQEQIAFTFAGKIWLVPRGGGAAKLFTKPENEETHPIFSPDGRQLAFSRLAAGDWDVYVTTVDGGSDARRITMMPESDLVAAWTPDGKEIVFQSTRDEETIFRLFKMNVESPTLAAPLPLPQSMDGSFSADGRHIAYTPRRYIFGEWRYYRGGMTAPVWITDLGSGATEKLPNQNFNDRNPMWIGDKIYFLSDRAGGSFNLFSYDRKTRSAKQLTKFDREGIRQATAFGDTISFIQDGRIHLFDLATGQDKIVNVTITPDTSELLPKNANAMRFVEQFLPSANGEKIAFGARGEVLVFDPKTGAYKNLTNTSGAAERYPAISPDGKRIAYFSDETGEYFLHVRSLETDAVKKIAIEPKPSFYWNIAWSPDSRKLVFNDRRLNLWLTDVESGVPVKIDTSDYSAQDNWAASFSPDSRFLTYAKRVKTRAGTVFIYDLAQKNKFQITDGRTHAQSPAFDANGKYLYFVSSANALTSEFEWGVLNGVFARPLVVRKAHALILSKDAPTPFLPGRQANPDAKAAEAVAQVKIDFENLENRFIDLPVPPRDYNQLVAGKPGKLFLVASEWTATPGDFNEQGQTQVLYAFDAAKPGGWEKIVGDTGSIDVTGDGSKILYRKGRDYFLTSAEAPVKEGEGRQDFSKMEVKINPAEEWRQIFRESARLMRDWFYDPNLHGQNIKALENIYAAYLPTTTRRADLNALIGRMIGSVSVSHLGVGGGDAPPPTGRGSGIGLLGADYAIENNRYRFKKIYRSTNYASVNGRFSAPLDAPGVDVREGDYLLEVNGVRVDAAKNILAYFENTVGKPTKITVAAAAADGSGARSFTVYPAAGENRLRRANWAENNRRLVEKLSGGRLGYIFIENYDGEGIMNAVRGLTANAGKAGVIIDQRFNGGGITPDYLIEWLNRKSLYSYTFRGGDEIATPVNPSPPVKVLIVNEWNGSAAETGAFMFKLAKTGSIVGKRTGGGGIGPYFFTPRLVDGGRLQIPNRAAFNPDGKSWGIENFGVEPDFDVEIMPQDFIAGKDPQLEKAIEVALAQAAKNPVVPSKRPVFPVHPGGGELSAEVDSILPVPGSAFPLATPNREVKAVTNGKFAEFLGQFETPMGTVTFSQEGEKLIGLAGGERIELIPDAGAKDKFSAPTASVTATFERDANGKITGVTVIIPSGRELKGRKIN